MDALQAIEFVRQGPNEWGVHDRNGDAHWISRKGVPVTLAQAKPFDPRLAPFTVFPHGKGLLLPIGGV